MISPLRRISLALVCAVAFGCAPSAAPPGVSSSPTPSIAVPFATAPDQFFTSGDARLRYRDIGQGEPVVLLHGYSSSLDFWSGIADSLALENRVIALDLRGFGQSSKFADPARYGRAMADDVIRLLDHLQIPCAHLVGHSLGALVAANAATRYPQRVATAAFLAGTFYADSVALAQAAAPYLADLEQGEGLRDFLLWLFPGMSDSVATQVNAQVMAQNDSAAMIAVLQSMGALVVPREHGQAVQVPALIAVGTDDPLLPHSRELVAWWPQARLLEVAGANHHDIISRAEVLTAIRTLLTIYVRPRAGGAHGRGDALRHPFLGVALPRPPQRLGGPVEDPRQRDSDRQPENRERRHQRDRPLGQPERRKEDVGDLHHRPGNEAVYYDRSHDAPTA